MTDLPESVNAAQTHALLTELVRLKTGETLTKTAEALEPISTDDMERDIAIAAVTVQAGCSCSKIKISETPLVHGWKFTKEDINPGLAWTEP